MKLFRKRSLAFWSLPVALLLNGCGELVSECNSLDARTFVVKIISGDNHNPLVNYAVKNSSWVAAMAGDTRTEAEKATILEEARQGAVYRLDEAVLTNSRNKTTQTTSCSGLLSVTVGDTTAQKQVDFQVKRTIDGKISVLVNPFVF